MKGLLIGEDEEVCFTNTYGPNTEREREDFWTELEDVHSWSSLVWCLGGDFNIVRYPLEKKGGRRYTRGMIDFFDFISRNKLTDLQLIGGHFTWGNGQGGP